MKKNRLRKFLVFTLVFAWLFTGWPIIWPLGGFDKLTTSKLGVNTIRIPPRIQEVEAASPETFTSSGTYTAATGIYSATVACWGGGGGGGIIGNSGGGGGGGGAYAATSNVSVTPGTGYAVIVGAGGVADTAVGGGDSTFNDTTVVADGGLGTTGVTGALGGTVANSTGTTKYKGGDGKDGHTTGDNGGGGGGAGGPDGAGVDGTAAVSGATIGGAGGAGDAGSGGAGGTGVTANNGNPGTANAKGGGGGGGGANGKYGGVGGAPGGGGGGGEVAGGQTGAAGQCIVSYTDTWAPSTALATYSFTWTFATAPANDSASQISMTATTGYEYTTPINYLFTLDNSGCGANAGTGGTTSSWQVSTSYSDSGLDANKCYGYTVTARDSVATPNTGTASSISSTYTSANTPGTPTLTGATLTTLNLTNAENSNPAANPATNFAVQVVTTTPNDSTWLNQWVNASGNPSATAVWLTDAQLDTLVLQGLNYGTTYGVKVKAKNEDGDETSLSVEGQGTTTSAIISVTITTEDKTVPYGILDFGGVKSTIDLSKTKTSQNNGNVAEDFTIKTSAATAGTGTNWALGSSAGENVFVHEFSSNGGGLWTKFATADEYSLTPLVTNIGVGTTQNFDLRITAPTSSDNIQKNITITVRATQY